MPPIRTPALVLHAFPYGDTSKILRILSPDYGVRSVIAKGARRPKSRFGAILEPFTEGEAQFNLREGVELFTLTGFSLLRSRQGIGHDLGAFTSASLLAEIVLRFATEEASPELYAMLNFAMDRLADSRQHAASIAIPALWALIALLGYRPEMSACVRCGRQIDDAERAGFDVEAGGIVCAACRPAALLLEPATRAEVDRMSNPSDEEAIPSDPRGHGELISQFLGAHLASDRPLRSLPLFLDQLG